MSYEASLVRLLGSIPANTGAVLLMTLASYGAGRLVLRRLCPPERGHAWFLALVTGGVLWYILKALIRAQAYYEANKEECVDILAKYINADHDYVAAYMLNDYYKVHADPLSNSIRRAWNILDKTGFLDENAKNINIDDHINTSIYEEALAECEAEFGAENPEFFASLNAYYAANNG